MTKKSWVFKHTLTLHYCWDGYKYDGAQNFLFHVSVQQGEFDWQAYRERCLSDAVCDWAWQSDSGQENPAR